MLFVGNDWAEDHHDVEIVDEQGRRLARRRVPEGLDGVTRLHALIAQFVPDEWGALEAADAAWRVKVGIETDRGQWVQALIAAGARGRDVRTSLRKTSARPPAARWVTRDVPVLGVDGRAVSGGRPFLRWAGVLTAPLRAGGGWGDVSGGGWGVAGARLRGARRQDVARCARRNSGGR